MPATQCVLIAHSGTVTKKLEDRQKNTAPMMETLSDYSKAETDNIRSGKGLVDEHEVMLRWKCDPEEDASVKAFRHLCGASRPEAPSGLRLTASSWDASDDCTAYLR